VQSQIIAEFDRLNLDPLVHAIKPDEKKMPARLSGRLMIHGDPRHPARVFGDGHVEISDSDLANVKALALLYNVAALGLNPDRPIGAGSLDLSLHESKLEVDNFRYLNRGIEARSSGIQISRIWNLPHSPIHGYVVGSARPLGALNLPLLTDVDKILSVVQSGLTTVRIDGTVEDMKPKIVPFSEVGDAIRRLIVGDVRAGKK
jgi:hypothetical protein